MIEKCSWNVGVLRGSLVVCGFALGCTVAPTPPQSTPVYGPLPAASTVQVQHVSLRRPEVRTLEEANQQSSEGAPDADAVQSAETGPVGAPASPQEPTQPTSDGLPATSEPEQAAAEVPTSSPGKDSADKGPSSVKGDAD